MSNPEEQKRDRAPMLPSRTPSWTVGRRVSRPDGEDTGTIVEVGDQIKVKWDSGRTSYFQRGKESNVLLNPLDESWRAR